MKKILLSLLCIVFIATGCGQNSLYSKYTVVDDYKIKNKDYETTVEISYDEYTEKIKNKDSFILLLYQTGCSHCESFKPTLDEIIKYYNLEIYALNLSELSDKEYSSVKNKTFVSGTPTTVVFEKGSYKARIVGSKEATDVLNFLMENGYLEEK